MGITENGKIPNPRYGEIGDFIPPVLQVVSNINFNILPYIP